MLKGMKDALDYGSANFSPYPLNQLSLAEIPQYKGAATAYMGVVFNAEKINYLTDYRDENIVNQSYAITTHEVGHQWWANKLAPVDGPGAAMLTESLAKYTEAMLLEKHFGKMYLRNYLKDDNNLYFVYRDLNEKELPLAETYEQNNVHYQKGGLVMYATKEILGETQVNRTLRQLINEHASPHPKAKTSDLIDALKQVAPADQQKFIDDSFNKVITYEMGIKVLACKALADGKFKVDLQVNVAADQQGVAQPQPPAMDIDVAFFDQAQEAWNRNTKPLYLKKIRFDQLQSQLSILVDRKPKVVAIDPYAYLLDADQSNNVQVIK